MLLLLPCVTDFKPASNMLMELIRLISFPYVGLSPSVDACGSELAEHFSEPSVDVSVSTCKPKCSATACHMSPKQSARAIRNSSLTASEACVESVSRCSCSLLNFFSLLCVMSLGCRGCNLPIIINSNNDSDCAGPIQVYSLPLRVVHIPLMIIPM